MPRPVPGRTSYGCTNPGRGTARCIGVEQRKWTDTEWIVVTTVRLPRVLVAAVAGAGLGLCGAAIQGLFRNPLAGPQVLGISNGAAWGGVVAILLGGSAFATVGLAFAFAFLALVCVFALDRLSGTRTLLSIVLAGVIVSAFFSALVGLAQYFANPERQLPGIVYWLLGSFAATTSRAAWIISVPTIASGLVLLAMRWRLQSPLSLGDADAAALGVRVDVLRVDGARPRDAARRGASRGQRNDRVGGTRGAASRATSRRSEP